jgi:hypothetical protein
MNASFFTHLLFRCLGAKILFQTIIEGIQLLDASVDAEARPLNLLLLALIAGASLLVAPLHWRSVLTACVWQLLMVAMTFPYTLNHVALELWLLIGAAGLLMLRQKGQIPAFLASSYLFVLFWSGVQKCAGGAYLEPVFFQGEAASGGSLLADLLQAAASNFGTQALFAISWLTVAIELALPLIWLSSERGSRWASLLLPTLQIVLAVVSEEWSFAVTALPLALITATTPRATVLNFWTSGELLAPWHRSPTGFTRVGFLLTGISLFFIGVWPIAHLALTQTLDLNPWRLFGWGMYATPDRPGKWQTNLVLRSEDHLVTFDLAQAETWNLMDGRERDTDLILTVNASDLPSSELHPDAPAESAGERHSDPIRLSSALLPNNLVQRCGRLLIDFPLGFLKMRCAEHTNLYLSQVWPGLTLSEIRIEQVNPPDLAQRTHDLNTSPNGGAGNSGTLTHCPSADLGRSERLFRQLNFQGLWKLDLPGLSERAEPEQMLLPRAFLTRPLLNSLGLWAVHRGFFEASAEVNTFVPEVTPDVLLMDLLTDKTNLSRSLSALHSALDQLVGPNTETRLDQLMHAIEDSPQAPTRGPSELSEHVFQEYAERRSHRPIEQVWSAYRPIPVRFARTVTWNTNGNRRNTANQSDADALEPIGALRIVLNRAHDSLPALVRETGLAQGFAYQTGRPFSDKIIWNDRAPAHERANMIWAYDPDSDTLVVMHTKRHTQKQLRWLAAHALASGNDLPTLCQSPGAF